MQKIQKQTKQYNKNIQNILNNTKTMLNIL